MDALSALWSLSATLSRPGGPNNAAELNRSSRWALLDVREKVRHPPFVASSSSTLAASATVVAMVGRRRPLATLSSLTLAASATVVAVVGRPLLPLAASSCGHGGKAAPARDLVIVNAGVVCLLPEGLGLTSALDGRDCLCAVKPPLLARGSVRGDLPRSTAAAPAARKVSHRVGTWSHVRLGCHYHGGGGVRIGRRARDHSN